jgi:hypothetical protein
MDAMAAQDHTYNLAEQISHSLSLTDQAEQEVDRPSRPSPTEPVTRGLSIRRKPVPVAVAIAAAAVIAPPYPALEALAIPNEEEAEENKDKDKKEDDGDDVEAVATGATTAALSCQTRCHGHANAAQARTMTSADGRVFRGQLTGSGQPDEGTITHPSGIEFTGRFGDDGLPSEGVMRIVNSGEHDGEFQGLFAAGVPNIGTYKFDHGAVFVGTIHGASLNNKTGTWRALDGFVQQGRWGGDGGDEAGIFHGTARYADGETFEGSMRGVFRIEGVMRWPPEAEGDGVSSFTGIFDDLDQRQIGTHVYEDGSTFTGDFIDDKWTQGIFTFPDGATIDGTWDERRQPIRGRKEAPDGTVFEGTFREWRPDQGVKHYPNGDCFEGTFRTDSSGQKERGRMIFADGSSYDGTWVSNRMRNGIRRWTTAAGERCSYEGDFDRHGYLTQGKYQIQNGISFEGRFGSDGQWIEGITRYASGDEFHGTFRNGVKEKGTYKHRNGDEFCGEFRDGKLFHGELKCLSDGARLVGDWKDGALWNGLQHLAHGAVYKVKDGKRKYSYSLSADPREQQRRRETAAAHGHGRVDGGTADRVRAQTTRSVDTAMFWQRFNEC